MAMDKALDVVSKTPIGSLIDNIDSYDSNELLIAIIKLEKYGLLSFNEININFQNEKSLESFIKLLLSNEDYEYYLKNYGFKINPNDLERIRLIAFKYAIEDYNSFSNYYYSFFGNKEEMDTFVANNREIFVQAIQSGKVRVFGCIDQLNSFVNICLSLGMTETIGYVGKYSSENLKLLLELIRKGYEFKSYDAGTELFNNVFKMRKDFSFQEFYEILVLFTEEHCYSRGYSEFKDSDEVIKNNMNYLIECISSVGLVPQILALSKDFRDECIRRNKMNLVVQCVLPKDIKSNEELLEKYSQELGLSVDELKKRLNWIENYYVKNNDVYDLIITNMLRDKNIDIPIVHFERFINDPGFQIMYTRLNDKELEIVRRLLNETDYKTYDVSFMIYNVISNIKKYEELINSLDLSKMNSIVFSNLIMVLINANNYYNVRTVNDLVHLRDIKKSRYVESGQTDDINKLKESMVEYLFNIDINMASYLNSKYCYSRRETCIINDLENSELSKEMFNVLKTINLIMTCNDIEALRELQLANDEPYNIAIPLETVLRREYSLLYSKSLYRVEDEERKAKDDPTKALSRKVSLEDKEVQMYIPRDYFNLFIHCLGTCTLGRITENFDKEWLEFPQVRDHFVACSYISYDKMDLRSSTDVVYGFGSLEGSALHGMSDTDIDSIGASRYYNGGYSLMRDNNDRAHFFVPSMLLKSKNGYNELVIERRDNLGSLEQNFKRKPDYIIYMVDTINNSNNFATVSDLLNTELSFLTDEEKEKIKNDNATQVTEEILTKYARELIQYTIVPEGQKLTRRFVVSQYAAKIRQSILYENSVKAAADFNIPIVTIDRSYYLRKIMEDAQCYDLETINKVVAYYLSSPPSRKRDIYYRVVSHKNYEEIIKTNERRSITIEV